MFKNLKSYRSTQRVNWSLLMEVLGQSSFTNGDRGLQFVGRDQGLMVTDLYCSFISQILISTPLDLL